MKIITIRLYAWLRGFLIRIKMIREKRNFLLHEVLPTLFTSKAEPFLLLSSSLGLPNFKMK